ncbi:MULTISPECIES: hypothetical protein [unclassified Moorena]|nr:MULTISPECIES: hypothetical protein [unclassified Moorena]
MSGLIKERVSYQLMCYAHATRTAISYQLSAYAYVYPTYEV